MKNKNKQKKNKLLKLIFGSTSLAIPIFMVILICSLMILDFFGVELTEQKIQSNKAYATSYKEAVNNNLENGYVPLQRILYFYLEDSSTDINELYKMNQNVLSKNTKEINVVCNNDKMKNKGACTENNLKINSEYLKVTDARFNFPLKDVKYTVTSFYNEERIIFDKKDFHNGWDFAVDARTPVYSVCSGVIETIKYTQNANIPFNQSNNKIGNTITIKCDTDYQEVFYVKYAHLYPNSSKVNVGDRVEHWQEIASVGTTGYSTGNHLHYQVVNSDGKLIDGMQLINFNL